MIVNRLLCFVRYLAKHSSFMGYCILWNILENTVRYLNTHWVNCNVIENISKPCRKELLNISGQYFNYRIIFRWMLCSQNTILYPYQRYGYCLSSLMFFYQQKSTVLCQNYNLLNHVGSCEIFCKTISNAKYFAKYSEPLT